MINVVKKSAESAVKSDKNGRAYKTCTFSKMGMKEVEIPGMGKIMVEDKPVETSVNLYEESYLDNKPHYGYHTAIGAFLSGDIVTRKVAPYTINSVNRTTGEITERTVDTYTTVVFCPIGTDAGAFESIIATTFRSRGHEVAGTAPVKSVELDAQNIELVA